MIRSRLIARAAAVAALVVAAGAAAYLLFGPGNAYTVTARFQDASQLVKGDQVQVAGVPVGSVSGIDLTNDGEADITMKITDGAYAPLRQGTQAVIRQASLSGVANRYVDLRMPPGTSQATIPDHGVIQETDTTSAVDLDQLFNTFDPRTRRALSGVIQGYAAAYGGRGPAANAGWTYLNPALAASSRLFQALNADTPSLNRFLGSTSKLLGDVAQRRDDLAALVDRLATTTTAIGNQSPALSSAIGQLPDFMRNANTTFVNLRATLDDLQPLVDESKPVARKLRPLFAALRPLANDARPTLRDLSALVRSPGPANDLVELTRAQVPLRQIAIGPVQADGKQREGALPASTKALAASTPELATARPYAPDLTGWFDDFSHSGIYDALGGASRAALNVNLFANANGVLRPLLDPAAQQDWFKEATSVGQRDRCPGAVERNALWKPSPDFPCDASQGPLGK